jgi:hypothetical protein
MFPLPRLCLIIEVFDSAISGPVEIWIACKDSIGFLKDREYLPHRGNTTLLKRNHIVFPLQAILCFKPKLECILASLISQLDLRSCIAICIREIDLFRSVHASDPVKSEGLVQRASLEAIFYPCQHVC